MQNLVGGGGGGRLNAGKRGERQKKERMGGWKGGVKTFSQKAPFFTPPPSILRGGHEERGAFLF